MHSLLFPGQGSQRSGMGAPFAGTGADAMPAWDLVVEASDVTGRDVGALLLDAPAEELVQTDNAQLATFVFSMVALDHLRRRGEEAGVPTGADLVAGHSLGEFSALCAAGAISYADGVRLVAARGTAMRTCTTTRSGTMAAILGLDDDAVAASCEAVGGDVWVANHNAPGQVVIAGDPEAVTAAIAACKDAGAKRGMALDVAGAFHTPFMAPAAEELDAAIAATTFHDTTTGVVANVDASVHRTAVDWPDLLHRQLTSPVRWTATVELLAASGVDAVIEVGPGAVLTGTVKRIAPGAARAQADSPDAIAAVVDQLAGSDA